MHTESKTSGNDETQISLSHHICLRTWDFNPRHQRFGPDVKHVTPAQLGSKFLASVECKVNDVLLGFELQTANEQPWTVISGEE